MTTPINLNRARKARAKAETAKRADENRVKHGRTKAEKTLADAERLKSASKLDAHKLTPDQS